MSTLPNQVNIASTWKQEVNQRIAAHKDRKPSFSSEPEAISAAHHNADGRAAAAAARVAARFAKAPSYSEILAGEARAAVRAAEAASKAALEAQAAAESVLAGLEAASFTEPEWELRSPEVEVRPSDRKAHTANAKAFPGKQTVERQDSESELFEIRWEPDMPVRQTEPAEVRATHGDEIPDLALESWMDQAWLKQPRPDSGVIETVEPGLPIHANLIEFPREIVATRRVRPRLAEGQYATTESQLSIFEVDPISISMEPMAASVVDVEPESSWKGPEWSGIELDEQPSREFLEPARSESPGEPELQMGEDLAQERGLQIAPTSLRIMAAIVNGALITGAFLVAIVVAASSVKDLPPLRGIGAGLAVAFALIAALYYGLFYACAMSTPGMRYAGVSLSTFDGGTPTRTQRFGRLMAMMLSVAPMGLGVMWAIFDEDHLSWHDRLSQTYLRKY
ncbi:MAG: RDD family protein [Terracidiphilus sp.]